MEEVRFCPPRAWNGESIRRGAGFSNHFGEQYTAPRSAQRDV